MTFQNFAPVLHVIGFLAASAIYGMLLVMCGRAGWSAGTRFPLAAGALGLGPIYGFLLVPLVLLTGSQSAWRRALWFGRARHLRANGLPRKCTPYDHPRVKDLEARLDPKRFIRLSRGALVHLESIQSVSPMPVGTYVVTLSNQENFPSAVNAPKFFANNS